MLVVAILTWTGFVLILIELKFKWTHGVHHMWHSILGMIVLVCAFFAVSEQELFNDLFDDARCSSSHSSVLCDRFLTPNGIAAGIGSIG